MLDECPKNVLQTLLLRERCQNVLRTFSVSWDENSAVNEVMANEHLSLFIVAESQLYRKWIRNKDWAEDLEMVQTA